MDRRGLETDVGLLCESIHVGRAMEKHPTKDVVYFAAADFGTGNDNLYSVEFGKSLLLLFKRREEKRREEKRREKRREEKRREEKRRWKNNECIAGEMERRR